MTIIPLGTNGFFPSFNRQTMCFAIPHEKTLIILDAGSGLFRFAEPMGKTLLEGITDVHLYLSHYHLDHTFGFYAAFKYFSGKKVTVFGKSNKHVFRDMTSLEYVGKDYPSIYESWDWKEIAEEQYDQGTYSATARKQEHNGAGSLAYRFTFPDGSSASYVTDSEPMKESVEFCKESTLLLHEHWLTGEQQQKELPGLEEQYESGHTTTLGAAMIAREAAVKQLFLIHHHPFHTDDELMGQQELAQTIFPSTTLARDLQPITF